MDVWLVGLGKVLIELMVSSTQGSLIMGSQCKRGLPKMLLLMLLQLQRVGGSFASPLGKKVDGKSQKSHFRCCL